MLGNTFKSIFSKYDTDKVTPYQGQKHGYEVAYDDVFEPIRNDVSLVFEIGVNRGGSVRAWKEYFPYALIVGIDCNPACFFEENRIQIEICDATKQDTINNLIQEYGKPDIVIDDGSHFGADMKSSFDLLFPHTKRYYVVEDLITQSPSFDGGRYIAGGTPFTNAISDEICSLLFHDGRCFSIRVYGSICFFLK